MRHIIAVSLLLSFAAVVLFLRSRYPILSDARVADLYDLLSRFQKFSKENNVDYRAIAGTYLGAVRHSAIIPWDDDVDVAVLSNTFDFLKTQAEALEKCGLVLHMQTKPFELMKLFRKEDGIDYGLCGHSKPVLDVFCMEKVGDIVQYKEKKARKLWPNEWFLLSEWQNHTLYPFGSIQVPGSTDYNTVCTRMWGDWQVPKVKPMYRLLYPFKIRRRLKGSRIIKK